MKGKGCLFKKGGSMEPTSELVYVVDGDRRVREVLAALMRANGRDVQTFDSGEEFLDTSRQNVVACLRSDRDS
jgi:FixJ family two-component response regulator